MYERKVNPQMREWRRQWEDLIQERNDNYWIYIEYNLVKVKIINITGVFEYNNYFCFIASKSLSLGTEANIFEEVNIHSNNSKWQKVSKEDDAGVAGNTFQQISIAKKRHNLFILKTNYKGDNT
jgi:hypothetical protein